MRPLLLCLLLTGCVATQRDMLDLSGQMDDLKLQMTQLQGSLESLQKNQADLFVRMDQVQTSMTGLDENLGDFNRQMSTLKTRWDDLDSKMDSRMRSVQETVQKQQAEETAALPGKTFREAELHLLKKNHDLAVQGFSLYLKLAPAGELADQAHFNLGEAHYGKGAFEAAAKAYATVLDRYPRSKLTAASRLRYALSLLSLPQKKAEEAERYLQSVLDDYPKSPEANAAAEHLKALQAKEAKPKGGKPSEAKPKASGGASKASQPKPRSAKTTSSP